MSPGCELPNEHNERAGGPSKIRYDGAVKIYEQPGYEWFLDWTNDAGVVTPERAKALASQLRRSSDACSAMRRILAPRVDASQLDDKNLVKTVLKLVENGSLILTWHSRRLYAPHVPEAETPVEAPPPVPQQTRAAEEEPEGFPEDHDQAAQAQALQQAAKTGAPFCEECEKARLALLAQQQQPPPVAKTTPPSTGEPGQFPANHDQAAQARALEGAAVDGVPFCEECEKARQTEARAEEEEMAQ